MRYYLTLLLLGLLTAGSAQRRDYAYFFAVDDYADNANYASLRNPVRDADALARELRDMYGWQTEVVRNPDRDAIFTKLRAIQQRSYGDEDQVLLFFSGHGEFDDLVSKGYFLAKGTGGKIDLTDLGNVASNLPCRHVLLSIDACYSGTIDQEIAFRGRGQRPGTTRESERVALIKRKLRNKSRLLLTSGAKQRTPDGIDGSPFTIGILTALRRGYGQGDGIVTYSDLLAAMERVSPVPHHGELRGHEQGGFLFISKDLPAVSTTDNRSAERPVRTTPARIEPARNQETGQPIKPNINPRTKLPPPATLRSGTGIEGLSADVAPILQRYLINSGGIQKWRSIENMVAQVSAQHSNGSTFSQYIVMTADGRRYFQLNSTGYGANGYATSAYDGRKGTVSTNANGYVETRAMNATEVRNFTWDPWPSPLIDPVARGFTVRRLADENMGALGTFTALEFTDKRGYRTVVYFNPSTGLPGAQMFYDTSGVASLAMYNNYQSYGGLMCPSQVVQQLNGGGLLTMNYTSIVNNQNLSGVPFRLQ